MAFQRGEDSDDGQLGALMWAQFHQFFLEWGEEWGEWVRAWVKTKQKRRR